MKYGSEVELTPVDILVMQVREATETVSGQRELLALLTIGTDSHQLALKLLLNFEAWLLRARIDLFNLWKKETEVDVPYSPTFDDEVLEWAMQEVERLLD